MKRQILKRLGLALGLSLGLSLDAQSDVYVVVDKDSPITAMSKKDIIAIYTGKTKALPNGGFAKPIDHPDESQTKVEFYRVLTNRSVSQINSYWARLVFSGRYVKPQQIAGDDKIQVVVAETQGAIAYVEKPNLDLVKVVYTVQDEE